MKKVLTPKVGDRFLKHISMMRVNRTVFEAEIPVIVTKVDNEWIHFKGETKIVDFETGAAFTGDGMAVKSQWDFIITKTNRYKPL